MKNKRVVKKVEKTFLGCVLYDGVPETPEEEEDRARDWRKIVNKESFTLTHVEENGKKLSLSTN